MTFIIVFRQKFLFNKNKNQKAEMGKSKFTCMLATRR